MATDDALVDAMQSHGQALRTLARAILRGADGADDAVQDACVAALSRPVRIDDPGSWLACVVRNFALRRRRDRARRERLEREILGVTPHRGTDECPAELDEHRRLADAVRSLPEPLRRALVLRYWYDLPPRRIAQQLGIPVATVKTHLQRGIAALRTRLCADHGDSRASLAALVPIAEPRLLPGAAGSPIAAAATALAVMKLHHVLVLGATVLLLGVGLWQPWAAAATPAPSPQTSSNAVAAVANAPNDRTAAGGAASDAAATATVPVFDRSAAHPDTRTCTVVGRIVTTSDTPVADARIRLLNLWEHVEAPPLAATAAADGSFALAAPCRGNWVPYRFALADAPGWATLQLEIDGSIRDSIADDRLDLGTLRLERGVAVSGRVVEADGSTLRSRARLLSWDPARIGSYTAMYGGRSIGFAEPGGAFALDERLAAGSSGAWMLAAVSPSGVGWATLAFAAGEQHLDPVEIRLLPGGRVDVRVVDADDRPVANAHVHATPHFKPIGLAPMWQPTWADAPPRLAEVEALFVRTTDADGRARFDDLPRGNHPSIRDANEDYPPVPAIIVTASRDGFVANRATLDPTANGTEVTITLTRERRVAFHGSVVTKEGTRVAGVSVRLGDGTTAVSDADGRYTLPEHSCPGSQAHFVLEGGGVPLMHALADIPPAGDRVEHDFVVELRAPVAGRVVDQLGAPVAGVELHLGVAGGMHYPSTPKLTGADGAFTFPDAIGSHVELWVRPPEPQTAWRVEPPRTLTRRDGEVVVLQRLGGPFVDLALEIVDGRNGKAVSPADVEVRRLHGSSPDWTLPYLQPELALGAATVRHLPPGRYRALVKTSELRGEHDFTLPDEPRHDERIEVWPAVALVCTVDASALPAADLAARSGDTVLVVLDAQDEQSYVVDAAGKRLNYTPNTGAFRFGGEMTFRLERVTPNVARRMRVLGTDLFGEAWFTASPGSDVNVTLRLQRAGKLAVVAPDDWPFGAAEIDVREGGTWRCVLDWRRAADANANNDPWIVRPPGDTEWRLRLWPQDGGAVVERSGTAAVVAGQTTTVRPTKLR